MNTNSNTILMTGGSTGIGLALASRLLKLGNEVIICGRRNDKLDEAKKLYPGLHTVHCDVSVEEERLALFENVTRDFPKLNVLFNNAGVQRYPKLNVPENWAETNKEIETNLGAPIHLSMLFAETLAQHKKAAILMTTSGLSHVPYAHAPIYSATKAALHSFTLSLRHHLAKQNIEVVEISPPMVNTDLGIPNTHTAGMNLDEYADSVIAGLKKGEKEITIGFSAQAAQASRAERDQFFQMLNKPKTAV